MKKFDDGERLDECGPESQSRGNGKNPMDLCPDDQTRVSMHGRRDNGDQYRDQPHNQGTRPGKPLSSG